MILMEATVRQDTGCAKGERQLDKEQNVGTGRAPTRRDLNKFVSLLN